MRFNEKALAKLQAPDDLSLPVRYAKSPKWLILAVLALIVAAGGVWVVTGEVPRTLEGSGILTHQSGSFTLQSPVAGQITEVAVAQGDQLITGRSVFKVRENTGTRTVRAVAGGRAVAVLGHVGEIVSVGTPLAVIERVEGPKDGLVAVLYVPAANSGLVPNGTSVDLAVQAVSTQQFGRLRGRVLSVGRFPATRAQVAEFLGDEDLARRFTASGPPVKVVIALLATPNTPSGFVWSMGSGPPFNVDSRMLVRGAIRLAPFRPIDLVEA